MDTVAQLRAARAMAKMTRADLARAAGVSEETVKRIENTEGRISANTTTVAALRSALGSRGVIFVPENGGPAGVRFREPYKIEYFRDTLVIGRGTWAGTLSGAQETAMTGAADCDADFVRVLDPAVGDAEVWSAPRERN